VNRRRHWGTEILCVFIALVFATIVVLFALDLERQPAQSPVPSPASPAPERQCLAVEINVITGETKETPAPCQTESAGGCVGSITVKVEPDGSVTSTCR
jgi:hypothetical protein